MYIIIKDGIRYRTAIGTWDLRIARAYKFPTFDCACIVNRFLIEVCAEPRDLLEIRKCGREV